MPPRILKVGPDASVENAARYARAAQLGFTHALLPLDSAALLDGAEHIGSEIEAARTVGIGLLIECDPVRLPLGHPLVESHPRAFALRRSADLTRPVDPRQPSPPRGIATARLNDPDARAALEAEFAPALGAIVAAGVAGIVIADPGAAPPEFWTRLVSTAKDVRSATLAIARTPGMGRDAAMALRSCGFDYLVSSIAWWDLRARWLVEEYEALRTIAPLLSECPKDAAPVLVRLAGALGDGLILPEAGDGELRGAIELASRAASFEGEMRLLSAASEPVTAVLRVETGSVRDAAQGLLVLVNQSDAAASLPADLLARSGADFEPVGSLTLQPEEVHTVQLTRGRRIVRKPSAGKSGASAAAKRPRLVIENVSPSVEGGAFPVRRIVGERVMVEVDLFGDGHEQLGSELQWRAIDEDVWQTVPLVALGNDRWAGSFPLERLGRHEFAIEGWIDLFGGFQRDFGKKLAAGVAQSVDEQEGRLLIERARDRGNGELKLQLSALIDRLDAASVDQRSEILLSDQSRLLMHAADERPFRLRSEPQLVDAERLQARFASWYELFPRSMSDRPDHHGALEDVIAELPRIRDMGFDVLYFPPIHPIGRKHRKGKNNSLEAGPDDPGSPYAIGSEEGGHDAIHPELGTFEDFRRLIRAAADHGLEIALDFAVQCSPDHPWLKEHPGWFDWRPDGTIKYAENPPKKYQDIVNVDFYAPDAVPDLWCALRDVVLLWVREGVKTFRVDNPHTKPLPFWEWMIREVRAAHPDTIFLAEAFTRPKVMYRLAKIGFSHSYTYFTWRNDKHELSEYLVELSTTAPKEFFRPHFFVNTPDINPYFLQTSGPAGFKIRAALATTLSGLIGIYSGFELCEWEPVAGKEEYLDSEKYEIRPRNWNKQPNIVADITLLNRIRKGQPALQTHLGVRFYNAGNDRILYFGKGDPASGEMILVAISLDPHDPQEADIELPLWEFGLSDDDALAVEDLVAGQGFAWRGKRQHVSLTPDRPYAIWRVEPER